MRALVLAGLLAAALAAAADARIVPGRSIGGVRLGTSEAQVRAKLGTPLGVERERGRFGAPRVVLHFGYAAYDVVLERGRAVEIATGLRSERLANGIGPGSTEWEATRAMKQLACVQPVPRISPRTGDVIGFHPRTCALRDDGAETVLLVSPRERFARDGRWRAKETVVLEVRVRMR